MSVIQVRKEGGIAWLILNQPDKLNVLGPDMPAELKACTDRLKYDKQVSCVIIKGAGDHFMAGGDIDYFKRLVDAYKIEGESAFPSDMFDLLHEAIMNIHEMNKPVIACVQGAVAGFGLSLMLACDVVLAANTSVFSVAYSKIATTPDGGMTYFLPKAVGQKRAMELALTGKKFSAEQAERWGMLNEVVPVGELDKTALNLAKRFCAGPKDVLARTKALLNGSAEVTLEEQLQTEAKNFQLCMTQRDFAEGVTSFCEKRPPIFSD